ncbi:MAG: hypothetical protein ABIN91_08435 [Mucilaginibacter sp.]|uniref:hypothetical protein n=1 Tax=Mucilaginibacter sp. TaxID=1882438 RepID=UPI003264270F
MSNSLNDIINLFGESGEISVEESFSELKITLKSSNLISVPSNENLSGISSSIKRDTLKVSILIEDEDSIDYYSRNNPGEFIKELTTRISTIEENETVEIQITITKNKENGILSVYYPTELLKYLCNLDFAGLLFAINKAFGQNSYLLLESQINNIRFNTKSISFIDKGTILNKDDNFSENEQQINLAKTVCNSNLLNQYKFTPSDFFAEQLSDLDYSKLFNRVATVYSIAFIYDITTIEKSDIDYKLNGYKSIYGTEKFSKISESDVDEYFKIYNWCYNGGNFSDKIGLARNIISLHFEKESQIKFYGNPYQSIQSSFKVYEKQNIKQYIEIRNKIADQLLSFHDRANKIIETFAAGFQKSALALISFYISAIILKLLSKTALTNVFTIDSTVLSIVFIICSYLYFRASLWEVIEQRKRFVDSYNNLKDRYLDLLDSADIQRILNNDKEFNSDLLFIDQKRLIYARIWLGYLWLLLIATVSLYLFYNTSAVFASYVLDYLFRG